MRQHDGEGIIGSRPPVDLGPLFTSASVEEAERELREDFVSPPAPAPRADEESDVFTGAGPVDHEAAVEKIQRAVREPLLALALERSTLPDAEAGVTAKDARAIADRKGLTPLLGQQQRAWSWLSTWLGQLAREGALVKYRRLDMVVKRMADNGNEQVVYLHPYDHRARSAA